MKDEESIGKLIQDGRKGWLYLLGAWTIVLLFYSGHAIAMLLSRGYRIQIHVILLNQIFHYYLALLCPLIYRISFKFRINRNHWIMPLLIHILILLIVLLGLWWIFVFVMKLSNPTYVSLMDCIKRHLKIPTIGYLTTASIAYYLIIFGVMSMIRLNRQQRLHEKKTKELQVQTSNLKNQLTQAKLQTLRMQLHPHFFFNALNSISSLVQNKQNQQAYKTIAQLGSLIRTTLELPHTQTIPLSKELEIIDNYLAIEKLRFPARLRIKKNIPKNCRNALVPSLILQPLVENCIRHAVSTEKRMIQIVIGTEKKQSKLILEISDNGPGLPDGWSMDNSSGIGLKNIRERLKVMYNQKSDFTVIPREPSGITVRIVIPFTVES